MEYKEADSFNIRLKDQTVYDDILRVHEPCSEPVTVGNEYEKTTRNQTRWTDQLDIGSSEVSNNQMDSFCGHPTWAHSTTLQPDLKVDDVPDKLKDCDESIRKIYSRNERWLQAWGLHFEKCAMSELLQDCVLCQFCKMAFGSNIDKSEEDCDLRFHSCNFCTKRFSTPSSLLVHMQIHAGEHQFRGRTNNQIINRWDLPSWACSQSTNPAFTCTYQTTDKHYKKPTHEMTSRHSEQTSTDGLPKQIKSVTSTDSKCVETSLNVSESSAPSINTDLIGGSHKLGKRHVRSRTSKSDNQATVTSGRNDDVSSGDEDIFTDMKRSRRCAALNNSRDIHNGVIQNESSPNYVKANPDILGTNVCVLNRYGRFEDASISGISSPSSNCADNKETLSNEIEISPVNILSKQRQSEQFSCSFCGEKFVTVDESVVCFYRH